MSGILNAGVTASAQTLAAQIAYPADGATNSDMSQAMQWTSVPNAQSYYLYVGTTIGGKDLVDTGAIQGASYLVTQWMPASQPIYARVYTEVGGIWRPSPDISFTVPVLTASFTYPANGAANVNMTQALQWTSVPNAQSYYLYVGTTSGAKDLVDTGTIQGTSYLVTQPLPANRPIYARVHTEVGGIWRASADISFTLPLTASFTNPANGATNVNLAQALEWTSVSNAQGYYLYVGTTSGGKDLVDTGAIPGLSYLVTQPLPTGQPIYARVYTEVGGIWRASADISFTVPLTATITYPADDAANVILTQSMQWTSVPDAQSYYLYVGTTSGGRDLVDTGRIHGTSYRVTQSLPANQPLFARVYTEVAGIWWPSADISFTVPVLAASITYPANGGIDVNLAQAMQWTSIPNAQGYYLYVGTTAGARDLLDTGRIQGTSHVVTKSLPANQPIYARVYTDVGGIWRASADISFTVAVLAPTFTFPLNGATGVNLTQPIQWTSVPNAQAYYLYVGTSPAAKDLVDTGGIPLTSYQAKVWPWWPAAPVYARVYAKVGGVWRPSGDISFRTIPLVATFLQPTSGATSSSVDPTQAFAWTSVPDVQAYYLYVGTTPGAKDLGDSGEILQTQYQVANLPFDGPIYARIYTKVASVWRYSEIVFMAGPPVGASMTFPVDGATNVDVGQPFQWTDIPIATSYRLTVGRSPGGNDVHDSGSVVATRRFVQNLPFGVPLFGRVDTVIAGQHFPRDFTFTAQSNSIAMSVRIENALWATDYVRGMATDDTIAYQWTPLARLLKFAKFATCGNYTVMLLSFLTDMNIGTQVRPLNLAFDPDRGDTHVLVQMLNTDTGKWILLDPTLDLTVTLASDGSYATVGDVAGATLAQTWSALDYIFLGPKGDLFARGYYLDYPLLYVNVYEVGTPYIVGQGTSPLPYMTQVPLPVTATPGTYVVQCSASQATIVRDGVSVAILCDGIGNLSAAFSARSVSTTDSSLMLFRVNRYVF